MILIRILRKNRLFPGREPDGRNGPGQDFRISLQIRVETESVRQDFDIMALRDGAELISACLLDHKVGNLWHCHSNHQLMDLFFLPMSISVRTS